MGSTSDKVSGLANQAAGKIKEGVGKATGDAKLETEGAAQDAKGKVQKGIGDAKGAIKDAVNKNLLTSPTRNRESRRNAPAFLNQD